MCYYFEVLIIDIIWNQLKKVKKNIIIQRHF
jgi:hypothetical protein